MRVNVTTTPRENLHPEHYGKMCLCIGTNPKNEGAIALLSPGTHSKLDEWRYIVLRQATGPDSAARYTEGHTGIASLSWWEIWKGAVTLTENNGK